MDIEIRGAKPIDRDWIRSMVRVRWGSEVILINKKPYQAEMLPGLMAVAGDTRHGFIAYSFGSEVCQIVYQMSNPQYSLIGTKLIQKLAEQVRQLGARQMRVTVTNDNLSALRFYQKHDFRLEEIRPGIIDGSRQGASQIPLLGENKIPIHDEIQLVRNLWK